MLTWPKLLIILKLPRWSSLVVGFDPSFPYKGGKGQGEGRYVYKTGTASARRTSEGPWRDDQKHGRGTYRFASGEVYEGVFANDTMHGHGTYGSADGGVYEGQFEDGKQHGLGTARHANGTVHMGRYEAGKLFEGAEWSPDRKTTWGNEGGKDV